MRLSLLPDQPPEPPTIAELQSRLEDLPYELLALGRAILNAPGLTADFLLYFADRLAEAVTDCRTYTRPLLDHEAATLESLAGILRDAAPRYPHPPRVPLTAMEAEASIRRRSWAAGLSTAGDAP